MSGTDLCVNKPHQSRSYLNHLVLPALKFGSEAWVLKKRDEQRLEAVQMKILRH